MSGFPKRPYNSSPGGKILSKRAIERQSVSLRKSSDSTTIKVIENLKQNTIVTTKTSEVVNENKAMELAFIAAQDLEVIDQSPTLKYESKTTDSNIIKTSSKNVFFYPDKDATNNGNNQESKVKPITEVNNALEVFNYRDDDNKYGLVVYDNELQPDGEWFWLYYVFGQEIACHSLDRKKTLFSVPMQNLIDFAKDQYIKWQIINENSILEKIGKECSNEESPPPRCNCPVCHGESIERWSIGSTASWQGASDQENFTNICNKCTGGYIDNILEP